MTRSQPSVTRLTDDDVYLWIEGTHYRLYEKLGAHHDENGTHFAVWAPNAERVPVVGDRNGWTRAPIRADCQLWRHPDT